MHVYEGTVASVAGLGGTSTADVVGFDIPALRAEINTSVQQGTVMIYMSEESATEYMLARANKKHVRITVEILD